MGGIHCNTECAENCERSANESHVEIWAENRPPPPGQDYCQEVHPGQSHSVNDGGFEIRDPFTVELFTGDARKGQLGMSISADDDPSYVTITEVWHRGLVASWNEDQHSLKQVRAGDAIVSADGVAGDSFLMMDAIFNEDLWDNVDVLVLVICPKQKLELWLGDNAEQFYNLPKYGALLLEPEEADEMPADIADMLPPDRIVDIYQDFGSHLPDNDAYQDFSGPYLPYAEEADIATADETLVYSNGDSRLPLIYQ